jgi:hypothetical protein
MEERPIPIVCFNSLGASSVAFTITTRTTHFLTVFSSPRGFGTYKIVRLLCTVTPRRTGTSGVWDRFRVLLSEIIMEAKTSSKLRAGHEILPCYDFPPPHISIGVRPLFSEFSEVSQA